MLEDFSLKFPCFISRCETGSHFESIVPVVNPVTNFSESRIFQAYGGDCLIFTTSVKYSFNVEKSHALCLYVQCVM